jgi:hypothetical protein
VHRPEQMGLGTATIVDASVSKERMAVGRGFIFDLLSFIATR